jgi:hypothetical protein
MLISSQRYKPAITFKIKKKQEAPTEPKKRDTFHYKHITPLELKIVGDSLTPVESRVYSKGKLKARLRRCLLFKSDFPTL